MSIDFSEDELIVLESLVWKKAELRNNDLLERILHKIQKSLNYSKRQFNKSVCEIQEWQSNRLTTSSTDSDWEGAGGNGKIDI